MTDRGCFALPSTFSHTSATCRTCVARAECGDKVLNTLQRIRGSFMVEDMIAQFHLSFVAPELMDTTRQLTLGQITMVESMPSTVAKRLTVLLLEGFDLVAKSRFARNDNPFPVTGAKHLHLAGQLLLAGGFTKQELREECMTRFGWTERTAFAQVSRAIALLRGLGLTAEHGARIRLRT